jgi:hypothetical protein
VRRKSRPHTTHPVASLAIPHRIADTQIAIEVDGVGKSIPETPNFLQASR